MRRYGYYALKDSNDNLSKLQRMVNKRGRKVNLTSLVDKYYESVMVSTKKFTEEYSRLLMPNNPTEFIEFAEVYEGLLEIMCDKLLDEKSIHLWADDFRAIKEGVETLDFNIWKRCKNTSFALEFTANIVSKCHPETECSVRIMCRPSEDNSLLQIGIDYYSKNYGFKFLETYYVDINRDRLYVCSFKEEENNCKIKFDNNELDVKRVYVKSFGDVPPHLRGLYMITGANCVLSLQSAIREYYEYIDAVKTITTVKGATRKISKMHEPRVNYISKDDSGREVFMSVSQIAIRKVYEKRPYQGGHHSSPIPHDVSGHWRNYKSGKKIWIEPYHKDGNGKNNETHNLNIYVVGE